MFRRTTSSKSNYSDGWSDATDPAFSPLDYEHDWTRLIEPHSYFTNGPGELAKYNASNGNSTWGQSSSSSSSPLANSYSAVGSTSSFMDSVTMGHHHPDHMVGQYQPQQPSFSPPPATAAVLYLNALLYGEPHVYNRILELARDDFRLKQEEAEQKRSVTKHPQFYCEHCERHKMPDYTCASHMLYDEQTGTIFCPILKTCSCSLCTTTKRRLLSNFGGGACGRSSGDDDEDGQNYTDKKQHIHIF